MAVKIIAFVAAMYVAVLFMKNTLARILFLYLADIIVVVTLGLSGMPETKLVFLTVFGFILNTIILLVPASSDKIPKFKISDFIFLAAVFAAITVYAVIFAASNSGFVLASPVKAAFPTVFMVFCAVFTAFYFLIKERPGETENE